MFGVDQKHSYIYLTNKQTNYIFARTYNKIVVLDTLAYENNVWHQTFGLHKDISDRTLIGKHLSKQNYYETTKTT